VLAVCLTAYLAGDIWLDLRYSRVLERNFYGALRVTDRRLRSNGEAVRALMHGTIVHGAQYLSPRLRREATTYYTRDSGVGLSLRVLQRQASLRVGLIGLGAGTLLSYGRPGDWYKAYDINPLVLQLAQSQFSFLADSPAQHEVALGDARLTLEREPSQQFDLLAVDAFSSDAIPVHLLTLEAFQLYWRHLKPDGVLAVHVSNKFLNLGPVVALAAAAGGKTAKMVAYKPGGVHDPEDWDSDWVLVSSRPGFFEQAQLISAQDIDPIPGLRPWTDDYSNLYRVLR
jgi:SAM-dependent methyltransferase